MNTKKVRFPKKEVKVVEVREYPKYQELNPFQYYKEREEVELPKYHTGLDPITNQPIIILDTKTEIKDSDFKVSEVNFQEISKDWLNSLDSQVQSKYANIKHLEPDMDDSEDDEQLMDEDELERVEPSFTRQERQESDLSKVLEESKKKMREIYADGLFDPFAATSKKYTTAKRRGSVKDNKGMSEVKLRLLHDFNLKSDTKFIPSLDDVLLEGNTCITLNLFYNPSSIEELFLYLFHKDLIGSNMSRSKDRLLKYPIETLHRVNPDNFGEIGSAFGVSHSDLIGTFAYELNALNIELVEKIEVQIFETLRLLYEYLIEEIIFKESSVFILHINSKEELHYIINSLKQYDVILDPLLEELLKISFKRFYGSDIKLSIMYFANSNTIRISSLYTGLSGYNKNLYLKEFEELKATFEARNEKPLEVQVVNINGIEYNKDTLEGMLECSLEELLINLSFENNYKNEEG